MKIALFSDTYLPDINGVATSTNILRNELIKLGHEVMVVTSELPSDSDYEDEFDSNILRVPGLEIQALYGYRACNIFSFKGMREIKKFRPEVIHVQTEFGIGIFGRIAGEYLDIPVVYTYHTMWADYSHYVNPMNSETVDSVVKKVIKKISNLYGNKCQELIVPSKKTKDALIHYGLTQKNIFIIPTGLELDRFDIKNKNETICQQLKIKYDLQGKFVLTFLGRIAQEKSIEVIIHALKKVVQINPDIKCLIVGGGPQLEELIESVENDPISEYIIFTGPQSGEYVPAHYHISDMFISASLSETQGLTYIEAMASSIPVIARYDNQLADVIIDQVNGFFFKNEDELPDLILKAMSCDLSKMKAAALAKAKEYSGETFAEKVLDVYHNAIIIKKYTYTVKSIFPVKNMKNEVVFSYDENESAVSLELTDKIIEEFGIEKGKTFDRDQFDALKDLEQVSRAYNKALKYLTVKDYTYHQMRKKLMDKGDYDDTQLDATLDLLCEKNLINDELYSINYLKRCSRLGIGINKAIYNLRNYGVDSEVIDHCLDELDDEEYQAATHLIDSYFKKNSTNSFKNIQKRIKEKLYIKGFTIDTIEKAMSDYDFIYDDEKEKQTLEKEIDKIYKRYSMKLNSKELKNKLIDSLLRKGYNYDDIKSVLISKENDNE
ncbi:RecX family transcriptional regulator [[Clostridium] spiroforme]|nr:RecX family transcriptional regulator [Thomasclavelia spiroformis]MBM6881171.1 RecX family transcriptional regulator [Thomasclavelia spiroformis]